MGYVTSNSRSFSTCLFSSPFRERATRQCHVLLASIVSLLLASVPQQAGSSTSVVFFDCEFENSRKIQLVESENGRFWRENDRNYPTRDFLVNRWSHDPLFRVFAYGPDLGSPRLDIFMTWYSADNPVIEAGTAILSDVAISELGELSIDSSNGFCKALE